MLRWDSRGAQALTDPLLGASTPELAQHIPAAGILPRGPEFRALYLIQAVTCWAMPVPYARCFFRGRAVSKIVQEE